MDTDRIAAAQPPRAGSLNVDHIAHFVPDIEPASEDFERLGFTLTPFSPQSHRLTPGGPLVSAGTGNRCVMLERGYLEFLTATGSSPVADQLRAAMTRYTGVHLVAFGTAAPELDYARLEQHGYTPLPPVALQRPIGTERGEELARFTVVRVPPGAMPEGRIQYCQQLTPGLLWQERWLTHRNAAVRLTTVFVCVDDASEAATRYSRFTGLRTHSSARSRWLETERGTLVFVEPPALERVLGVAAPVLPWIAGYALETQSLAATRSYLEGVSAEVRTLDSQRLLVELPRSLGGILIFQEAGSSTLMFD
jgi:hypothetical protein